MTYTHPAAQTALGISGYAIMWIIVPAALGLFAWILYRRWLLIRLTSS